MSGYYLTMEETSEVVELYGIAIPESQKDFIDANRELLDKAAAGDGDASLEVWYKALDAGFIDEYNDREILDSINTLYGCDKDGE